MQHNTVCELTFYSVVFYSTVLSFCMERPFSEKSICDRESVLVMSHHTLEQLFEKCDTNGNGYIDRDEFCQLCAGQWLCRGLFRFLSLRVPLSDKPTYDLCAEYLCIESLENPSKFYGFRSIIAQKFAGSAEPVEPVLKRPLPAHKQILSSPAISCKLKFNFSIL